MLLWHGTQDSIDRKLLNAGQTGEIVPKPEQQTMSDMDAETLIGFGDRSRQEAPDGLGYGDLTA